MNDSGNDIESLAEKFLSNLRSGVGADVEAFAAAHPDHADELRELLPLMMDMEEYGRDVRHSAQSAAQPTPDLSGSDYQLERKIGSGGMGVVWEATQLSLNRKVAIKIMRPPRQGEKAWRERFTRESQIVAQLHHPNIVKVFGAGSFGKFCYYAMELVDGERLDRHRFASLREKVQAVLKAAPALAYAHRCGIIHRDIKPANLMLDSSGDIHIADFGLATALNAANGGESAQDGTLRYMAPERLTASECGPAADQYALGVTLIELITGKPLFDGAAGTELARRICGGILPPKGLDGDLAKVIAKSTAADPTKRYGSMDALAEDLRAWLDGRCVAAAPPSTAHRLMLWAKRKPAMAGLAATALLCAAGFATAISVGLARTSAALDLAAKNAALADAALDDVFNYIERTSISRRGAELLSALLPYYGRLAGASGLDKEKAARANEILGACAFRCGDYHLAERAFRRLTAMRASARGMNRLAATLRRLGRSDEADELSRRVAAGYADSKNAGDQYEAALALETIASRTGPGSHELNRAFTIARDLRAKDPTNPDFRFLHARILAERPSRADGTHEPSVAENAFELLSGLATDYPDRPEYSSALVSAMERQMRTAHNPAAIDRKDVELALDTADSLIGRYPNAPDIVSSVISFRDSYSSYLKKIGKPREAHRESVRTTGMLELLSHSTESPDAARLCYSAGGLSVPYRQIVAGADNDMEPTNLILAMHDRTRNGDDNVRQTTAPFLRSLVSYAEALQGRTVIILPQCPSARQDQWLGSKRNRRDGLLPAITSLVRSKATEFGAPPGHVFAVGVETGADACSVLISEHPDLFARALVAGAKPQQRISSHPGSAELRDVAAGNRKAAAESSFDRKSLDWLIGYE